MSDGKIIIPAGANVWPHELETAKALANYGYKVEFKKADNGYKVHSADAYVIFDSARIKKIPDAAIQREILTKAPMIAGISKIIFVNRKRNCIDIYKKVR